METRLIGGCSSHAPFLLLLISLALSEPTRAITVHLQPWKPSSLISNWPYHYPTTRLGLPQRDRSLFDDFALSNVFDDPFPSFPPWAISPFEESLIDIAPLYRHHRHRCPRRLVNDEQSARPNHDAIYSDENRHQENIGPEERPQYEDAGTTGRENRESRLQAEIERERAEIRRRKALIMEQRENKRREEEEYARRESLLQKEVERERAEIRRREAFMMEQRKNKRREEEEYARREREWMEKRLEEKRRGREIKEGEERRRREELELRESKKREELLERQRNQARRRESDTWHREHQKGSETIHREEIRQSSSPQHEFITLAVKDYNPEDISIVARGNKITVSGLHVCGCDESCFEREFQRMYTLPRDADPTTLRGHIDGDGVLSVRGERRRAAVGKVTGVSRDEIGVPVDGHRLHPRNGDSSCRGRKGGIKLKKMIKRTGEVFDDIEMVEEHFADYFEGERGGDGITIEVEEY